MTSRSTSDDPACKSEIFLESQPAAMYVVTLCSGFSLKVKPGVGEGYEKVECGACDAGWQVPHYAERVG